MGKTIMNRITLILATVLSLAFSQASAQDFFKGANAYKEGDYATAIKEWKPLPYKAMPYLLCATFCY